MESGPNQPIDEIPGVVCGDDECRGLYDEKDDVEPFLSGGDGEGGDPEGRRQECYNNPGSGVRSVFEPVSPGDDLVL